MTLMSMCGGRKLLEGIKRWFKRFVKEQKPVVVVEPVVPKPVVVVEPIVEPVVPKPVVPKPVKKVSLKNIVGKYSGISCVSGTDKGTHHSYIDSYNSLLSPYIGKGIMFMEIGIATGKCLLMWQEFLQNAKIHGMEIANHRPAALNDHPEIITWQANSIRKDEVSAVVGGMMFDVIIDDGSHEKADQVITARLMLPKVKPGGLYIIEDIQNDDLEAFKEFGKFEFIDLRGCKGVYDDMLIVFRKS